MDFVPLPISSHPHPQTCYQMNVIKLYFGFKFPTRLTADVAFNYENVLMKSFWIVALTHCYNSSL